MSSSRSTLIRSYFISFLLFTTFYAEAQTNEEDEKIFTVVEVPPVFPGGKEGMSRFLSKELQYPTDARRMGVQGKVFIQFVVGNDGAVDPESVVVLKGVSPSIDKEAIRVVKLFPAWTPGYQNGKPVKSRYVLPLNFKLDGDFIPGYDTWFHGVVTRNDGTTSTGEILHDLKTGNFWFQSKDQHAPLAPRTIKSFKYKDDANGVMVQHVTLEFTDLETGIKGPVFFELLQEFPSFALLSRKTTPVLHGQVPVALPQETIYILNQDGSITPYCTVASDLSETLTPMDKNSGNLDDVLKSYIKETRWPDLEQYASEQNLSFEKKKDLLKILYYYSTLLQ